MFNLGNIAALPRVQAIGSCRLETALQMAVGDYQFTLNTSQHYGFVHTTTEALQLVRWMRGELDIPEVLWPFVSVKKVGEVQHNGFEADALVMELSNTHPVVLDGYALQLNRLRDGFADFPELWQIWRKYPGPKRINMRMEAFAQEESFSRIDAERRAILERALMVTQTPAMLCKDLAAIRAYMPESFFVMTYAMMGGDRPDMLSRNKAIAAITEACACEHIPLFNPTADINAFGIQQGFAKGGKDIHHYSNAFTEHLGNRLAGLLGLNPREIPAENQKVLLTRRLKNIHIEENTQEALALADALLALSANAQLAWEVKARTYTYTQTWGAAAHCWDRVLQLAPQDTDLHIEAMESAYKSGDYARATNVLEQLRAQGKGEKINPMRAADIYLASHNLEAAVAELRGYVATNTAPMLELIATAEQPTWLAAASCRAIAETGNLSGVDSVRTKLCVDAIARSIKAVQANDMGDEIESLRLAQFVAAGDKDLMLRVQGIITAAIGSALATAAKQANLAAMQAMRLEKLIELRGITSEVALPAAELLASCGGLHANAASLLSQSFDQASERAKKAIVRQLGLLGKAALQQEDLPAAHAYVRVLKCHATAMPATIKLLSALLKRETRLMRTHEATATARTLLEIDSHNVEALRMIAFAPDSTTNERSTSLKQLLSLDPKAAKKLELHLKDSLARQQVDLADIYYAAWVDSSGTSAKTHAWRTQLVRQRTHLLKHAVKEASDTVAALADALLALEPNNPDILKLAARALAKQASWYAAHAYAKRLVKLVPTDNDALALVDKCAQHLQDVPRKSTRSA